MINKSGIAAAVVLLLISGVLIWAGIAYLHSTEKVLSLIQETEKEPYKTETNKARVFIIVGVLGGVLSLAFIGYIWKIE